MDNNTHYIILSGYGFSEEPYLTCDYIYPDKKTTRSKIYIRNRTFSITQLDNRFCVGRFDLSDFSSEPCPEKKQLIDRSNTCMSCFRANGFNPAFYHVPRERLSQSPIPTSPRPRTSAVPPRSSLDDA